MGSERGLEAGTLAVDTRFRDALRRLAGVDVLDPAARDYALPPAAPSLEFPPDHVSASAAYAHDTQPLHDLDAEVRLAARVAALERRVVALERRP